MGKLGEKREACYESRDKYFACLERLNKRTTTNSETGGMMATTSTSSSSSCETLLSEYTKSCPESWRTYFNKQKEREAMVQTQAGVQSMRAASVASDHTY